MALTDTEDRSGDVEIVDSDDLQANTDVFCLPEKAKSIKCTDCGKLFLNDEDVERHSLKMSHQHFEESQEEIKPLTDQEKAIKLKELKEKLQEKRMLQKIREEQEVRENELIRRKRDRELLLMAEEKKRQAQIREIELRREEKRQDLIDKKRIKERIEADKCERKKREEKARAMRSGIVNEVSPILSTPKTMVSDTTRLQIRVEAGTRCSPIICVYSSEDTLRSVAQSIFEESGVDPNMAIFISTFPKKEYFGSDLDKTLKELSIKYLW